MSPVNEIKSSWGSVSIGAMAEAAEFVLETGATCSEVKIKVMHEVLHAVK
jgi:hypothetical protein